MGCPCLTAAFNTDQALEKPSQDSKTARCAFLGTRATTIVDSLPSLRLYCFHCCHGKRSVLVIKNDLHPAALYIPASASGIIIFSRPSLQHLQQLRFDILTPSFLYTQRTQYSHDASFIIFSVCRRGAGADCRLHPICRSIVGSHFLIRNIHTFYTNTRSFHTNLPPAKNSNTPQPRHRKRRQHLPRRRPRYVSPPSLHQPHSAH